MSDDEEFLEFDMNGAKSRTRIGEDPLSRLSLGSSSVLPVASRENEEPLPISRAFTHLNHSRDESTESADLADELASSSPPLRPIVPKMRAPSPPPAKESKASLMFDPYEGGGEVDLSELDHHSASFALSQETLTLPKPPAERPRVHFADEDEFETGDITDNFNDHIGYGAYTPREELAQDSEVAEEPSREQEPDEVDSDHVGYESLSMNPQDDEFDHTGYEALTTDATSMADDASSIEDVQHEAQYSEVPSPFATKEASVANGSFSPEQDHPRVHFESDKIDDQESAPAYQLTEDANETAHPTIESGPEPTGDSKSVSPAEKDAAAETKSRSKGNHIAEVDVTPAANQPRPKAHYSQNSLGEIELIDKEKVVESEDEWQPMATVGSYEVYDDANNLLVSKQVVEESSENAAASGYTRVANNDDAESINSLDDKTDFLFAGVSNQDPDDEIDINTQVQTTKSMLTDQQKIAYIGLCRLVLADMGHEVRDYNIKNNHALESLQMWGSKIVLRLYTHMSLSNDEQLMIEQLAAHDIFAEDLTNCLKTVQTVTPEGEISVEKDEKKNAQAQSTEASDLHMTDIEGGVENLKIEHNVEVDVRWTVMCDLFLLLLTDGVYDARSRTMLELVGKHLEIESVGVSQFERKVTEALQLDDAADQDWTEQDIIEARRKAGLRKKIAYMGLATLGGGLVIGLSAGLLAPVIGAGLAAGLTTIGITGTSGFLAGAGGAAIVTTTGTVIGAHVGNRSMAKRVGHVKTFEFRPIFNNHRMNMIVTVSGWMTGSFDDVRLPFSTIDPLMGDCMSVLWEPEMMRSLGQTINILATEALTQGVQQILAATVLTALMSSVQLPMWLAKLSYLLDNPWSVSLDRAWAAGKILADVLIQRNLGERPVTLMGFSLGARVIFSCLSELAKRDAYGLIQDVFIFGTPVFFSKKSFTAARSVVSGRFVSGYSNRDWILAFLFPASRKYGTVLGLNAVPDEDAKRLKIENIDVTADVDGHMMYRTKIPKLLADCGISVLSEEFEEIEDPDPDKLREKQRSLLSEIEGKQPKKKRFWPFSSMKWLDKAAESPPPPAGKDGDAAAEVDGEGEYIFDVHAIRQEMRHVNPEMIFDAEEEEAAQAAAGSSTAKAKMAEDERSTEFFVNDDPPPLYSRSDPLPELEDEPEVPPAPLFHPDERDIVLREPPRLHEYTSNQTKSKVVMNFDDEL